MPRAREAALAAASLLLPSQNSLNCSLPAPLVQCDARHRDDYENADRLAPRLPVTTPAALRGFVQRETRWPRLGLLARGVGGRSLPKVEAVAARPSLLRRKGGRTARGRGPPRSQEGAVTVQCSNPVGACGLEPVRPGRPGNPRPHAPAELVGIATRRAGGEPWSARVAARSAAPKGPLGGRPRSGERGVIAGAAGCSAVGAAS